MKSYELNSCYPFIVEGHTFTKCFLLYKNTVTSKEKKPKSYKEISSFTCKEHGIYESGNITIYKVGKKYAASLYKDGCFSPYYAFCRFE